MWIWIGVGLLAIGAIALITVFALMAANMLFNRESVGAIFACHLIWMVLLAVSGLSATAGVGILLWQLVIYLVANFA